jgi:hypothetical protein
MYEGRIVAFCPPTIPEQELGLLMAGSGLDGSTAPDTGGATGAEGTPDAGAEPETAAPAQEPSSHE